MIRYLFGLNPLLAESSRGRGEGGGGGKRKTRGGKKGRGKNVDAYRNTRHLPNEHYFLPAMLSGRKERKKKKKEGRRAPKKGAQSRFILFLEISSGGRKKGEKEKGSQKEKRGVKKERMGD